MPAKAFPLSRFHPQGIQLVNIADDLAEAAEAALPVPRRDFIKIRTEVGELRMAVKNSGPYYVWLESCRMKAVYSDLADMLKAELRAAPRFTTQSRELIEQLERRTRQICTSDPDVDTNPAWMYTTGDNHCACPVKGEVATLFIKLAQYDGWTQDEAHADEANQQ